VDLVANGEYPTPAAELGFTVDVPQLTLDGIGPRQPVVGPLPDTELWPVMYDLDDDNKVHFSDLAFWAAEFPGFVGDFGADRAGIADHSHNGRVFFEDLAFFSPNFGKLKGDILGRVYAPNFPADWRVGPQRLALPNGGETLEISGESSGTGPSRHSFDESALTDISQALPEEAPPAEIEDEAADFLAPPAPAVDRPNVAELCNKVEQITPEFALLVPNVRDASPAARVLPAVMHELDDILGQGRIPKGLWGQILPSRMRSLWDEAHESLESESEQTDRPSGFATSAIDAVFGNLR
jgi:hypothetical protein